MYTGRMRQKPTPPELLTEAKRRTAILSGSLPNLVDPADISHSAKTPYNALVYRELLLWRVEEFARIACELFETKQLATALTITRSCVETVAAHAYPFNAGVDRLD